MDRSSDPDESHREGTGTLAGTWLARPESHLGHELIAAGLLILSGATGARLGRWVRIGYEPGQCSLEGYDPSG